MTINNLSSFYKNRQGFSLTLIVAVVTALILIGGAFYFGKLQTEKKVDVQSVDTKKLIQANMEFDKKLFVDFNGDGQKEIVLIGKDKNRQVGGQASKQGMPIIDIFQYSTSANSWNKAAEVNYLDFPQNTNYSFIYQIVIISMGKYDGLVFTYAIDGSHINERFLAVVGNNNGIKTFDFPDAEYISKGGDSPHKVRINVDGLVTVDEGLYKPEDSNNSPTNGMLTSTFQVDSNGIHFQKIDKFAPPQNLIIN